MIDTLAGWADAFVDVFRAGADTFVGLLVGIVPIVIVFLTGVNALVALIGPERVERFGEWAGREGWIYLPIRYLVWPFISVFMLTNPVCYVNGRFLPERYKPAFYDSAVSMVHPPLGIFPHVNAGELFVWLGIANGITALGLSLGDLAVRYLLTGFVVILIRGIVTERITAVLIARRERAAAEPEPA